MNTIIKAFIAAIPMMLIYNFVYLQLGIYNWKTERIRKIVSGLLAISWSLAFGAYCGYTGFLKD